MVLKLPWQCLDGYTLFATKQEKLDFDDWHVFWSFVRRVKILYNTGTRTWTEINVRPAPSY